MKKKRIPFHNRILVLLLAPVLAVGFLASTLLTSWMSAPVESFLIRQFDANLRVASTMGMRTCEDSFDHLLDLRLEMDAEMNRAMQNEAMQKIKDFSRQFPQVHLMILKSGRDIKACTRCDPSIDWQGPPLAGVDNTALAFPLDGRPVRSYIQFFPFWDWHIISFVFEEDYAAPVRLARNVTYLSAIAVFVVITGTLLLVFHLFISRPLNRLVGATEKIAEGHFERLEGIPPTELGHLMISFNDMTAHLEERNAEVNQLLEQLRESEAMFRSQFEHGNIGISIASLQEGWVRLNQRFCRMIGYTEKELQKMAWATLTHPDDLAAEMEDYQRILAGDIDNYDIDKRIYHKNGQIVYVHVSVSCIRNSDHSVRYLIASFLDITDRKQAEEKLKRNANFTTALLDAIPTPVFYKDREGLFQGCNRAFSEFMGVTVEEIRGKRVDELWAGRPGRNVPSQGSRAVEEPAAPGV
jgi:PAS domain S-box-containing protein